MYVCMRMGIGIGVGLTSRCWGFRCAKRRRWAARASAATRTGNSSICTRCPSGTPATHGTSPIVDPISDSSPSSSSPHSPPSGLGRGSWHLSGGGCSSSPVQWLGDPRRKIPSDSVLRRDIRPIWTLRQIRPIDHFPRRSGRCFYIYTHNKLKLAQQQKPSSFLLTYILCELGYVPLNDWVK